MKVCNLQLLLVLYDDSYLFSAHFNIKVKFIAIIESPNFCSGCAVKRLDIGGITYLQTRPGTLVKASTQVKRMVAR